MLAYLPSTFQRRSYSQILRIYVIKDSRLQTVNHGIDITQGR